MSTVLVIAIFLCGIGFGLVGALFFAARMEAKRKLKLVVNDKAVVLKETYTTIQLVKMVLVDIMNATEISYERRDHIANLYLKMDELQQKTKSIIQKQKVYEYQ